MKDRALVRNSADSAQVQTATQREKLRGEQEEADLRAIMSTPQGRRFMRRLIVEVCGRDRCTYAFGPAARDSDMVLLEGMRNVGLQVFSEVKTVCPELWLLAEKEHEDQLRKEGLTQ